VPVPICNVKLVVTGVSVPEVPVTVIVDEPVAVAEGTVSVSTLEVADEVGLNAAVTPVGMPDAAKVTLPVNPFRSATEIVLVPVLPGATVTVEGEAESVKPGAPVTVIVNVVVEVVLPEVPVSVIGYVPGVTVQAAVKVTVSLPLVTGLVPNVTVKPVGKPDAASVILPVNPPESVTVIVPEAEPQSGTEVGGKTASEKPDVVTVSVMEVVAVNVPEVPVMVIG